MKNSKTHLKIIAIIISTSIIVILLRYLVRGNIANWIVNFIENLFQIRHSEAQRIYHIVIRSNLDFILIAVIIICAAIVSSAVILYTRKQEVKAEKQLEQRKNDLITYLAHDIKTPLTSVIGYLSLLNETPDMPNEQKVKHISIALDKAYRLESLVNQFFEITQYNLQTIVLSQKDIDLNYMLVQLTDEAYPQIAAHNKETTIHAPEDLTVYGDPDKLARAFNNILKNAIAYGEEHSVIDITASIKNDTVSIEFKNIGSVPNDKLSVIFDKFYRLDEARSSDTGGAGLGLAIAKEIISIHGGSIIAKSENGYTIFTVCLPIKKT